MIDGEVGPLHVLLLCAAIGFNLIFWGCVGGLRLASTSLRRLLRPLDRHAVVSPNRINVGEVAVIIPAHNEEAALPKCIQALLRIVPPSQIFVASDGSGDSTVAIARSLGCRVADIQPNRGKARALQFAIHKYRLVQRFKVVLILDADSEIDPHYLEEGLPLFDNQKVVAVAGHVRSRWPAGGLRLRGLIPAYRTRLYAFVQAAFQYGQSWRWTGVSYIVPGFCSMYRSHVLPAIDIAAPGLLIEDFNMTFEVQRKRLGRIAYTPRARCSTEDPLRFGEYRRQCLRWYTGFWQTVWRHGIWPSRFWLSLGPMIVDFVAMGVLQVLLPLLIVVELAIVAGWLPGSILAPLPVQPTAILALFLAADYFLTMVTAVIERRPSLLVYGLAFPFLRFLEAMLYLRAIPRALLLRSDGRWTSPGRHLDPQEQDTPALRHTTAYQGP